MNAETTQQPDTQFGHYYVSIRKQVRGGYQTCLALGPFDDDHAAALAKVDEVRHYASDHNLDPFCEFLYGTCRLPSDQDAPSGKLNALIES